MDNGLACQSLAQLAPNIVCWCSSYMCKTDFYIKCWISTTFTSCYRYLATGGGCEVLFSPGLSVCVCVCVCVSVCPANILIFYFSATRRDIDLKLIQYTYRVVLDSLKKNWPSYVKGQCHRDVTLLFEGTVISQKLSHRKFQIFFHRHLLGYSIRWNNKNLNEQRNDVTKHTSIFS